MAKKYLKAICRPSAYFRRITQHDGDVSESSKTKIIAVKRLLSKTVIFYANGLRSITGVDITEQEQYDSQILRFAHASILINAPVGDKKSCYVDATKDPIEVVIYNTPIKEFIKKSVKSIRSGVVDPSFLLDTPISELKNERNVKLFGR